MPTLEFLPGEFHGQRSLVGNSPWGGKELDMTERLTLSLFQSPHINILKKCLEFKIFNKNNWQNLFSNRI